MRAQKSASRTSSSQHTKHFKPNESRRGFIRVDFDPGSKIGIATSEGQTSYDALDLSVYGLSFLASPEDSRRFSMGSALSSLAFMINGHQISVRGKVAYLRSGLIAGLSKVAIEFTDIAIDDVWLLSRYVAEKSGVNKPGQIGGGLIELEELLSRGGRKTGSKKKRGTKKAAKKAKTKPKGRKKASRKVARKTTKKKTSKKLRRASRRK